MNIRQRLGRIWYKIKYPFRYLGENVAIGAKLTYTNGANISVGDYTSIGMNCILLAGRAELRIGNYVMLAPNVTIVTGNHRTDLVGEYMRNVTEDMKLPSNDQKVTIEDDVWVGTGAIVLKGVTIGRGSIIGAGAVVRKNVPPYTIYVNEDFQKPRFSKEQIREHERLLKEKYGVEYPAL